MVPDAVWVRATLVVASSLLTFAFARSAARGSRKGLLRLRIVARVMLVGIVAIVARGGRGWRVMVLDAGMLVYPAVPVPGLLQHSSGHAAVAGCVIVAVFV